MNLLTNACDALNTGIRGMTKNKTVKDIHLYRLSRRKTFGHLDRRGSWNRYP